MEIKNERYEMRYNRAKNRVYFKIVGFWSRPEVVPNYVQDWKRLLTDVKPGYTILTDATEMAAPPDEVVKHVHVPAQQVVMKAGVSKIAEVVSRPVTQLSVQRMARESGMASYKREFNDRVEAEKWLDEAVVPEKVGAAAGSRR